VDEAERLAGRRGDLGLRTRREVARQLEPLAVDDEAISRLAVTVRTDFCVADVFDLDAIVGQRRGQSGEQGQRPRHPERERGGWRNGWRAAPQPRSLAHARDNVEVALDRLFEVRIFIEPPALRLAR